MARLPLALYDVVQPVIEALGYELLGIEYFAQGSHSLLRIYVDSEDGVKLDDCSKISHQISGVLDVEEPIKGQYSLEISSPGLDRPLFNLQHYKQFIGHNIKLRLIQPIDKRKNFKGKISRIEDKTIVIYCDDIEREIGFDVDAVEKANLIADL